MNYRMTAHILGKMLGIEAATLLIPALVSVIYGEDCWKSFLITSLFLFIAYLVMGRMKPEDTRIYGKDGLAVVALAWIFWSAFGALPFFLDGCIPNYVDALFETVSGFTTTGSTILTNIEALPKGMSFWRSFTHWIGGMGVLVFVMMVTKLDDKGSMNLMRAEVPGPETDKLVSKSRQTAQLLYGMYFALTVAEVIFLLFGGMSLFDSIMHSFSTAGTGGFSNRNASVGYYDSAYIDGVITVFMILFGVNFSVYFLILLKKVKSAVRNEELRIYLGVIAAATLAITINLLHTYETPLKAFQYAVFQVASVITTTGFATADYNVWPEFSKCILLLLMVIGACAGSTGGGMKVARITVLIKGARKGLHRQLHPQEVSVIKLNGKKMGSETMRGIHEYLFVYVGILMVSVLLVSLDNFDFSTTFSAVLTTMNNVGPGIAAVGPVENFSAFSMPAKLIFCFDMLAGRLELFPFLMIFSPALWKKKF